MIRRFLALAMALAALAATACGRQAVQEPPKPPPAGEPRTRLERPADDEEAPKLIAPPPAYGNKVVMAKAGRPRDL